MSFRWKRYTSKKHQEWDEQEVLVVGKDKFTRADFAHVRHTHPMAVARLNNRMHLLHPKGIEELARRTDPEDFYQLDGVGDEALIAFMVAMEITGLNSDKWWHSNETFATRARRVKEAKKAKPKRR